MLLQNFQLDNILAAFLATYRLKTLGVRDSFQRERVEARLMLLFRRPLEAVRPIVAGEGAVL